MSNRCGRCVKLGETCDVAGPSEKEWDRVESEQTRLRNEEDKAFEEETAAYKRAHEMYAKRMRLRKQGELLKRREGDMLRRGLKNVEELEALDKSERQGSITSPSTADFSSSAAAESLPSTESFPWSAFLADEFDETLLASSGS